MVTTLRWNPRVAAVKRLEYFKFAEMFSFSLPWKRSGAREPQQTIQRNFQDRVTATESAQEERQK